MRKIFLGVLLCLGLTARPAAAQFLGFTSPQTVTQQVFAGQTTPARTPLPSALVCIPTNGSPCGVRNQGQTFHYFTYTTSSATCVVDSAIQASYDGVNFFNISADASANNILVGQGAASPGITANGWFPVLAINLLNISNCPGGINGFYSGGSAAAPNTFGVFTQSTGERQTVLQNTNLNFGGTTIVTLATPFFSSGGNLYLICTVTCGAGANTFSVQTSPSPPITIQTIASFTAANSTVLQVFAVPPTTAQYVQINFPLGNFSTTNASMYYEFSPLGGPAFANGSLGSTGNPAVPISCDQYLPVNITASTQFVAGVAGKLIHFCSINILPGAVDNVALVEGTGATCGTGTLGVIGGPTPATGLNLAANENYVQGTGVGQIARTAVAGNSFCILVSTAAQLSGGFTFTQF